MVHLHCYAGGLYRAPRESPIRGLVQITIPKVTELTRASDIRKRAKNFDVGKSNDMIIRWFDNLFIFLVHTNAFFMLASISAAIEIIGNRAVFTGLTNRVVDNP